MNWQRGLEMRWQHKISLSSLIAVHAMGEIRKDETGTLEDVAIATSSAVAIVSIWYPEGRVVAAGLVAPYVAPAALAVVTPIIVGGALSYAVGGEQGVVDYYEFITEPKQWISRTEESLKVVKEEVIMPQLEDVRHGFNWFISGLSNYAERKLREAKRGLPSWF
jgi:hypothetical protein